MPKIVFIGAGSTVFAKKLLGDILSFPELADSTISLFDIDEDRLSTSAIVARKVAQAVGAAPDIQVTTDRRAALECADYAICMMQVAGYRPGTIIDFEVPKKYGLRQTIGDTLGVGGIMRALRTIPVLLDMCRDMEELCPDVTFLNYVNPMAMNCWAISRASKIRTIGLCHSVQETALTLSKDIGVPIEEINYMAAGINHVTFYLRFERNGEDLYPLIRRVVEEGRVPDANRVRYEVLTKLGYFVTESSEHFSEYTPWFIKRDRKDLIERFNIPLDEYIRRCEAHIAKWESLRVELEGDQPLEVERSREYGSLIIHSMETGPPPRDLWKRAEQRVDRQFASRLHCRGSLSGGQERRPTDLRRQATATACGSHADEYQRSGTNGGSSTDRQTGAYLSRSNARSPYGG
jgi:alpha-galactosidase